VDQNFIAHGPARKIFGPNQNFLPFELLHVADRSQTLHYCSPNEARSVYSVMRLVSLINGSFSA
jgi:hypothetical protein